MHFLYGVTCAAASSVAEGTVAQIRLEDRFQYQLGGGLHHSVPDRRNTKGPLASSWLRYHHPSYRLGLVRFRPQFLAQAREPLLNPRGFDVREFHPVHSRRAAIAASEPIRVVKNVLPVHLVVERVEAER